MKPNGGGKALPGALAKAVDSDLVAMTRCAKTSSKLAPVGHGWPSKAASGSDEDR
jgi:hypothetical protein